MYAVVAALVFLVAVYTQANLLFWGFGLLVGGFLVSVVLTLLMLHNLELQRILPSHGVVDEPMVLRYQIVNRKRMIPVFGLVIAEKCGRGRGGPWHEQPRRLRGCPFGWVLHLGANQQVQAEAPCWPMHRGFLEFERVVISTSFPFGVVRRIAEYPLPGKVLIYPHLWRINRQILHRLSKLDPSGRKRLERAGGHEEFFGTRQYRPGDSFKMIDWKHTAKTGELVSREMTQPSPPKIMIALDLSSVVPETKPPPRTRRRLLRRGTSPTPQEADGVVEMAISLTASLVCDAHFQGCQIGLAVLGVKCNIYPIHHSLPHRMRMLESLSLLDMNAKSTHMTSFPAEPTVVVYPHRAEAPKRFSQAMLLGTERIDEYVLEIKGGATAFLGQRPLPRSRRQEMRYAWA